MCHATPPPTDMPPPTEHDTPMMHHPLFLPRYMAMAGSSEVPSPSLVPFSWRIATKSGRSQVHVVGLTPDPPDPGPETSTSHKERPDRLWDPRLLPLWPCHHMMFTWWVLRWYHGVGSALWGHVVVVVVTPLAIWPPPPRNYSHMITWRDGWGRSAFTLSQRTLVFVHQSWLRPRQKETGNSASKAKIYTSLPPQKRGGGGDMSEVDTHKLSQSSILCMYMKSIGNKFHMKGDFECEFLNDSLCNVSHKADILLRYGLNLSQIAWFGSWTSTSPLPLPQLVGTRMVTPCAHCLARFCVWLIEAVTIDENCVYTLMIRRGTPEFSGSMDITWAHRIVITAVSFANSIFQKKLLFQDFASDVTVVLELLSSRMKVTCMNKLKCGVQCVFISANAILAEIHRIAMKWKTWFRVCMLEPACKIIAHKRGNTDFKLVPLSACPN